MTAGLDSLPTVVVVSYGRPDLLARCLQSVHRHAPDLPVHVWDNRSGETGAVRQIAASWPRVTWTFHPDNIGFAAAVNRVSELVAGDLLLLNPDAELVGSPAALLHALDQETVAAAGPLVEVSGLRPWDNARRLPGPTRMIVEYWGLSDHLRGTPLSQRYRRPPRTAGYVSGACLLIRRRAWSDVGPFDERFWLYSEEVDWARRAGQRGWCIKLVPVVLARHVGGASTSVAGPTTPPDGDVAIATPSVAAKNWLFDMQVAYLAKHHGRPAVSAYRLAAAARDLLRDARRRGGGR